LKAHFAASTGSEVSISAATNTKYIIEIRRAGTTFAISLNGGSETPVTTGSLTSLTGTVSVPGSSTNQKATCNFYEFLIWNADIGLANRNIIGRYLAKKHGLTWTDQ
jgi:hypothetical protein